MPSVEYHSDVDVHSEYELPTEETSLLDVPSQATSEANPLIRRNLHLKFFAILFLVNIAFQILGPAQVQIYQQIYCAQYYQKHDPSRYPPGQPIPDDLCKIAPVQQQIATLRGWLEFFDALPSLFTALPIGMLADTFGRQPFLRLYLSAMVCQQVWITVVTLLPSRLPLRAIWAGCALNLVSGGPMVAEMLFNCVITDITTEEQVSTVLFRFASISQATRILGPAIAGTLMHVDPWFPILVGLVGLALMMVIAWTVPETLGFNSEKGPKLRASKTNKSFTALLRSSLPAAISHLRHLTSLVTSARPLTLTLIAPIRIISAALAELLQQYASNRYHWNLADAAYLYSLQAVFATIVLFLLLPSLSNYLMESRHLSALRSSVWIMRGGLFMLGFTYVMEGFAPTIPLLLIALILETLGVGFSSSLKAVAGLSVAGSDKGRMFSILAVSEALSKLVVYPVTTALFNVGLERVGGHDGSYQGQALWLGLPYLVGGLFILVQGLGMSAVNFGR